MQRSNELIERRKVNKVNKNYRKTKFHKQDILLKIIAVIATLIGISIAGIKVLLMIKLLIIKF